MKAVLISAAVLAAVALSLFVASRLVEAAVERAHPPRGDFVERNGIRLHVLDQGSGPAVVLLHGANGSVGDWAAVSSLLADFRVVAIDRPGHGYSSRPEPGPWTPDKQAAAIREALAAISVARPILVGFSWGGTVATAYALDHPAEVAGIVTVGAPFHDWPTPVNASYRLPTWPVVGPAFTYGLAPIAGRLLGDAMTATVFAPETPPPEFAASPWPLAVRSRTYLANAEDIRELKPFLLRQKARYAGLDLPVEILHGTGDGVVSVDIHARPAAAAMRRARLTLVAGAGHMIPYTRPELVAAAIRRIAASAPR